MQTHGHGPAPGPTVDGPCQVKFMFTVFTCGFCRSNTRIRSVVLDRAGRIWVTDPRYGGDHSDRELDHDSVYRITPSATGEGPWEIERLTFDTTRPNGLLLSWDERTLFLAQSDYDAGSVRQLRAYPIGSDGTLDAFTVLHDFGEARGIDGM